MGFLRKLTAAIIQTTILPVEIVKDIATLGGVIIGKEQTFTGKRLRDLGETIEDAIDDLKR